MSMRPSKMLRPLASPFSGTQKNRKLQILIYHRVLGKLDPLQPSEPSCEEFDWQMDLIASFFNVLPLEQAVEMLRNDKLPPLALCITFDDGYADNLEIALPILRKYSLPATIFVATGYLDGGIMFNDAVLECLRQCDRPALDLREIGLESVYASNSIEERRGLFKQIISALKYLPSSVRDNRVARLVEITGVTPPNNLMLKRQQLPTLLKQDVDIGAHTVSHPILSKLSIIEAQREIAESRDYLNACLPQPVKLFAYPNGIPNRDYTKEHAELLPVLGFKAGVTTAPGHSTRKTSPYELHRFTPWDKTPRAFLLRLLKNYV
jgi:peptidoglycan/xylan/chitin deacetylase (PgdA/CDA1 family)